MNSVLCSERLSHFSLFSLQSFGHEVELQSVASAFSSDVTLVIQSNSWCFELNVVGRVQMSPVIVAVQ